MLHCHVLRRCALALCAIGLRLGVGSKEGIMAMDESAALFASAQRTTWRGPSSLATQRLIIASFRDFLCKKHHTRNLVE